MLIAAAILNFLKANWKLVAIGLAIATVLGYIGVLKWEVNHYRTKYEDAQLQLAEISSQEEAQKASAAAITRKYKDLQAAYAMSLEQHSKILKEKIRNDKELASTRISLAALELFNESKQGGDTSTTVSVHDGEANTPSESSGTGVSVPLTTIFQVVEENDKNHLKCVKQVEDWQNFWRDYESSVQQSRQVTNASP